MQKRLLATVLGISKPGRSWGHSASQVPGEESTIRGHDVVSRAETRSYQPQEGNTRAISECPGVQVLTGQRGVGRQAGISCQEKTREVGNLSQVTKANGHPCDDNVVFVGNDLLMGFYLIKLDRLGQHLCS